MSLRVWLPLNGNLNNQGLSNITVTNSGATVDNNGKIGKCYSFNSNKYLSIPNPITTSTTAFSIATWVYVTQFNSGFACVCSGRSATSGAGIAFWLTPSYIRLDDGAMYQVNATVPTGTWVHVCATWSSSKKSIYLNGQELGSSTSISTLANLSANMQIGSDASTTTTFCLNGKLNDFRIYDHALSPKEIEILSRGLVCHYPLNGNGRSGENLYTEPYWKYSTTKWGYAAQVGTVKPVLNTDGSVTFTGGGGTNSQCYIHHISNRVAISASTTYTVSCKVTASGSGTFKIYLYQYDSSGAKVGNTITTIHGFVDGETKTISNTITTTSTTASFYAELNMYGSPTTSTMLLHANSLKIEKSDHPTPWMPNPADAAYTAMGYNSTTEYDVSGYGYNGTKNGTFAYDTDTPRYSVCTKYSGSNYSYVTSPSSEIRTIAFWAKWDSIPSGQSVLFMDYKSKTGFGLASNGIICSSNGVTSYTFNKSNLVANTWYHFAIVCPNGGSNASRKLYMNGVEQTATSNQNVWIYAVDQLQIGKRSTSSDGLAGKMSDFRAYATALSAAQVVELYNTAVSVANNGTLMGYELVEG